MAARGRPAPGRRRGRFLAVLLVLGAAAGSLGIRGTAGSQQDSEVSALVHPGDWGIVDLDAVRGGQIGLIQESEGIRLEVYRLRDEPLREFPPGRLSAEPVFSGNSFVVSDFHSGVRNQLGGLFSAFAQPPSEARVALADAPDGRRGLRLTFEKAAGGFCGAWIHFFDITSPPDERVYLDARALSTLSFWVRGARGGERLRVKVADREWERRGDALAIGDLGDFLLSGRVESGWRQAVIPLDRLPARLDRSALASVVLEGTGPAHGEVYVSRLALSRGAAPLPSLPAPVAVPSEANPGPAATWIWNTADYLGQPERQDSLALFLSSHGFGTAFLQLVSARGESITSRGIEPDDRLGRLVGTLHASGIQVYALDGAKELALPANHGAVFATIRNVLRYNERVAAAERFDGIRYDIEPYLLPGFHGPRREEIIRGYLEVLARGAALAREGGLRFGADIPFWFDSPNEVTFERVTAEFRGERKPVSEHVIDLADDIAVMAYRTAAFGADGILRHAEGEIRYATRAGKRAWIALETGLLPDETLVEFAGEAVDDLDELPPETGAIGLISKGDSALVLWRPPGTAGSEHRLPGGEFDSARWWPIARRIAIPADKLSFARPGLDSMRIAMGETARELSHLDAFAGFAIHYSESYGALLHR